MKFTQQQLVTLSQFEEHFNTAVHADWTRHPGAANLRLIHQIYTDATGAKVRLNDTCNICILRLVKECGRQYYADRAELEKMQAQRGDTAEEMNTNAMGKVCRVRATTNKKGKVTDVSVADVTPQKESKVIIRAEEK